MTPKIKPQRALEDGFVWTPRHYERWRSAPPAFALPEENMCQNWVSSAPGGRYVESLVWGETQFWPNGNWRMSRNTRSRLPQEDDCDTTTFVTHARGFWDLRVAKSWCDGFNSTIEDLLHLYSKEPPGTLACMMPVD